MEHVTVLRVGGLTTAEHHIAIGGVALCVDAGQQLTGAAGDDLHLDAVALFKQGNDRVHLRVCGRGIDDEDLFLLHRGGILVRGGSLTGRLGFRRGGGALTAAGRQAQRHGKHQKQYDRFFHRFHCFLSFFFYCLFRYRPEKRKVKCRGLPHGCSGCGLCP